MSLASRRLKKEAIYMHLDGWILDTWAHTLQDGLARAPSRVHREIA